VFLFHVKLEKKKTPYGQINNARSAHWPPVMPSDAQWCPVKMRASAFDFLGR
jgi:hypothetical protein